MTGDAQVERNRMMQDVYYQNDWRGKKAIAAGLVAPRSTAVAVDLVLQAVFLELQHFNDRHYHEEGFVPAPTAELMLNASNRLPAEVAEIVLSIEWLRSEVPRNSYELDENLRNPMLRSST